MKSEESFLHSEWPWDVRREGRESPSHRRFARGEVSRRLILKQVHWTTNRRETEGLVERGMGGNFWYPGVVKKGTFFDFFDFLTTRFPPKVSAAHTSALRDKGGHRQKKKNLTTFRRAGSFGIFLHDGSTLHYCEPETRRESSF